MGVEDDTCAGSAGPTPADLDRGVALAGHHVGVGHDQPGRAPPSRCPRPPARRRCRTRARRCARGRRAPPGCAEDPPGRRRHVGGRAAHRRQRIEPRQRVEDRARRRQQLVELASGSPSAGCRGAAARAGRLRAPPRRRSRRSPRPTQAVSTAPSSPSTVRSPGSRRRERTRAPRPSRPLASTPPAEQRAEQAEQRRVRRPRSLAEHQRRQPRADEGPDREPDQRQRADDEPLQVAVDGQQDGERDDHPVDARSSRKC